MAQMGETFTGFWLGGPKGRDQWEDPGIGGSEPLGSIKKVGYSLKS
jgi:hypothetical protein